MNLASSLSIKVKLVGEGADDAGGVFDDTITEMCRELVDPERGQNLLVPTPNGFSDTGFNRDKYMPNPGKNSPADLKHYWFIGTSYTHTILIKYVRYEQSQNAVFL